MSQAAAFPAFEGVQVIVLTIMAFGWFTTWLYQGKSKGDASRTLITVGVIGVLSLLFCLGLQNAVIWLDDYLGSHLSMLPNSGLDFYLWFIVHPIAQAYKSVAGVISGSDQTVSFITLTTTLVLSAGMVEELTKLFVAGCLIWISGKRKGYLQIASATILSGLAFGVGEAFAYFYRFQDRPWTSHEIWERGCVLPALHASWVFLNGMLCLPEGNPFVRAFRKGGLWWFLYLVPVLLPGAALHGFYDAIVFYQALHPSGLLSGVRWILIVLTIGGMLVAAMLIKRRMATQRS